MNTEIVLDDYNKMIYHLIHKWFKTVATSEYDNDDYYQEAVVVFYEILPKFDQSRNTKFSTFYFVALSNHFNNLKKRIVSKSYVYLSDNIDDILLYGNMLHQDEIKDGLSEPFFSMPDSILSLKETIKSLPECAKNTLQSILDINPFESAKSMYIKRINGEKVNHSVTSMDILSLRSNTHSYNYILTGMESLISTLKS